MHSKGLHASQAGSLQFLGFLRIIFCLCKEARLNFYTVAKRSVTALSVTFRIGRNPVCFSEFELPFAFILFYIAHFIQEWHNSKLPIFQQSTFNV